MDRAHRLGQTREARPPTHRLPTAYPPTHPEAHPTPTKTARERPAQQTRFNRPRFDHTTCAPRQVTVYRLICGGTVEERIVRRAQQKSAVQQLVMTGSGAPPPSFTLLPLRPQLPHPGACAAAAALRCVAPRPTIAFPEASLPRCSVRSGVPSQPRVTPLLRKTLCRSSWRRTQRTPQRPCPRSQRRRRLQLRLRRGAGRLPPREKRRGEKSRT